MKVSEAKEKVCPFMQDGLILSYAIHDKKFFYEGQSVNCLCICGECMAWKWKETYEKKNSIEICGERFCLPKEGGWKSLGYDSNSTLWGERILISDSEGYCSRLSNG